MKINRSAGMLLHPTSLPGPYGIGDLGYEAFKFIDFMKEAGQKLWQVFPLGPTGFGDSPYQCFSAFAGNPLLISPDILVEEKLLDVSDLQGIPHFDVNNVQFGEVINFKHSLLEKAFNNSIERDIRFPEEFEEFCNKNEFWLEDFALFMAGKKHYQGKIWADWDKDFAARKPEALKIWKEKLAKDVEYQKFIQFHFFKQWNAIKAYANEKEISVIGDLPIYVSYDSSDVWADPELFSVNEEGKLTSVAGVPPDYFSPTGQLWGNPLYNWDEMKKDNFAWWIKRFSQMYKLVDIVRIDHFRGFEAYYKIAGDAKTAEQGEWVKAPGMELFKAVKKALGNVPILAEDLGVITPEVEELRDHFEFPGMKILQFAFGDTGEKRFLPHNHTENSVVYTGSHDNETTAGFFWRERDQNSGIYHAAQDYMNFWGEEMCEALIKTAYKSVANIVIIPLQDIFNLGNEARMNFPGQAAGNWTWRFTANQLNSGLAQKYNHFVKMYAR
ncbi:MAG: 4-alpha-glucanotransferase [Rhodothermaceae bacterium]